MRIGIITNNEYALFLIHALKAQGLKVHVFFCLSPDNFVNQQIESFAQTQKISYTVEKNTSKDLYDWVKKIAPDAIFISGYPHLIDVKRLGTVATRTFNIHSGALPAFRGPSPVFWQLKLGIPKLAVSIHLLSEKFDDGPVIWMKETDNLPHYNCRYADVLLSQMSIEGVFFILQLTIRSLPLIPLGNKDEISKYYKRPVLTDVTIDWKTMPAESIVHLVKACNPWNKGAATFIGSKPIKITDAVITGEQKEESAGYITTVGPQLGVVCADKKVIHINMLFYNDFFIPAYQCPVWGINTAKCFG